MEYKKLTNLLGTTPDEMPRSITKKWIEVHDQLGNAENRYNQSKQIRFKTLMLRSDLCDCSDAYIVVKGKIIVTDPNNNAYDKKLAFKNNALFVSCISKINNTLIDNAEDLDIVMPIYNLLEYNKNYSKTMGSFWNYYKDEPNKAANNNINYWIKDSKSFDYKTSITGKLESNNTEKETGIVAPLKHLSNFWRIYILRIYSWNILLEQLRTGFKRTIKWNKYRSEMTNQTKNNNSNSKKQMSEVKTNIYF